MNHLVSEAEHKKCDKKIAKIFLFNSLNDGSSTIIFVEPKNLYSLPLYKTRNFVKFIFSAIDAIQFFQLQTLVQFK